MPHPNKLLSKCALIVWVFWGLITLLWTVLVIFGAGEWGDVGTPLVTASGWYAAWLYVPTKATDDA